MTAAALAEPEPYLVELRRPRTRGDCKDGPRPCPWVSCRHHLYLDVRRSGSLQVNFPGLEPHEMERSCSLDIADEHPDGATFDEVAAALNLTRERARHLADDIPLALARHLRRHAFD